MLREFWERNLSVIPVSGKRPFFTGWDEFCNRLPTEEEIDLWEEKYPYPKYGIGLCCGAASNIIVIDWDTESPDIKSFIPYSPIIRYGSKGGASFYQYSEGVQSTKVFRDNIGKNKDLYKHEGVEIFASGQVVIPPSIHPDTHKPYIWVTQDNLENFDVKDLPKITKKEIEEITAYVSSFNYTTKDGVRSKQVGIGAGGRNCRLTEIICAIIANGTHKKDEEIAEEIYNVDQLEFNSNSYFHDKEDLWNKRAKGNASLAALLFTKNHRERMVKNKIAEPYNDSVPRISVESVLKTKKKENKYLFPKTDGLIYTVQSYVNKISKSKQDELSLGASLAILSALSSNKFHYMGKPIITHLYIMNMARSGQGKGSALTIANKIFSTGVLKKHNVLGLRNYSSIAAIVSGFPAQRARLDLIDEFSSLIEGLTSGNQITKEIETIMTELFTTNGDFWTGHYTKTNGASGACYSPCLTLLANIQEDTLTNKATKTLIDSGFLSRFIYFSGKDDAEYNEGYNDPIDVSDLTSELDRVFPFYNMEPILPDGTVVTDIGKIEPRREPFIVSASVNKYRNEIDKYYHFLDQDLSKQGKKLEAIFYSRFLQLAERVAFINAIGMGRRELASDDIDFGMNVITASYERVKEAIKLISSNSKFEKKVLWAEKALKRSGYLTHSEMLKNSNINASEFKQLIDTMIQSKTIVEFIDSVSSVKCYKLNE